MSQNPETKQKGKEVLTAEGSNKNTTKSRERLQVKGKTKKQTVERLTPALQQQNGKKRKKRHGVHGRSQRAST